MEIIVNREGANREYLQKGYQTIAERMIYTLVIINALQCNRVMKRMNHLLNGLGTNIWMGYV